MNNMYGIILAIISGVLIGVVALFASYGKSMKFGFLYFVMLQLLSFAVLLKSLKLLGIL